MHQTKRELRNFGFTMSITFAVVFGILIPLLWGIKVPAWPWIVSTVFLILALIGTPILRFIYKYWMMLGHFLGAINSRILLTVFFFTVVTPIGLLLRLFGKRPLSLKWREGSYKKASPEVTSLNLPF